jgi:hypothetical protein
LTSKYLNMENLRNSVLNVGVSCFQNYKTTWNPVSINLMTWLTSRKYKDRVEAIRSIDDKKERDAIKSTLPGITPSGTFSYRNQSNLITHSGLIQIDIDPKKPTDIKLGRPQIRTN